MRQVVVVRAVDAQAALQIWRFETEIPVLSENRAALANLNGQWSDRFHEDFQYQARRWDKPRRAIAKIERHQGALFPKVGFIATNPPMEPDRVVRFDNRRGTAEQHVKEGEYAFHRVRLRSHALAY